MERLSITFILNEIHNDSLYSKNASEKNYPNYVFHPREVICVLFLTLLGHYQECCISSASSDKLVIVMLI